MHLENQQKVWLEQGAHFEEIYIWLKNVYLQNNPDPFAELREEVEEEISKLDKNGKKRLQEVNEEFKNPLGEMFD